MIYGMIWYDMIYDMIWNMIYLTAIGLPPGGISIIHIYTQTAQNNTVDTNNTQNNTIH
jgi:hypothetical protein